MILESAHFWPPHPFLTCHVDSSFFWGVVRNNEYGFYLFSPHTLYVVGGVFFWFGKQLSTCKFVNLMWQAIVPLMLFWWQLSSNTDHMKDQHTQQTFYLPNIFHNYKLLFVIREIAHNSHQITGAHLFFAKIIHNFWKWAQSCPSNANAVEWFEL